jgi:hypothetical protein
MPKAIAARNESFMTENGSTRDRVSRTLRGPPDFFLAAFRDESGASLAGVRLAPRPALPEPF